MNGNEKTPEGNENVVDDAVKEPVDLGAYVAGEGSEKLNQDQMMGVGGGTPFYEIIDANGTANVHVAMPVLMRDRSKVQRLLKAHAQIALDMQELIENRPKFDVSELEDDPTADQIVAAEKLFDAEENEKLIATLEEMENRDINILLKVAHYCFQRVEPKMKGLDVDSGATFCENWMDIKQLRKVPDVAMGLNRFNPMSRAASLL